METRIEYTYKRKGLYRNNHLKLSGENLEDTFSRFSFPYFLKDQKIKNIILDETDKFFLSFFENSIIKTDFKIYSNAFFIFDINKEYIAEYNQNSNNFWLSYEKIWSKIALKYSFNYKEVKELTKYLVKKHFKMEGVTTENTTSRHPRI